MRRIIRLDDCIANKGFEFSVVQKRYCNPFAYPTPFELHYSRAHKARYLADPHNYVATMRGEDKDLAAHFTVIDGRFADRKRGDVDRLRGICPK